MAFTLVGPSHPWWLVWIAGAGIAAAIISWRAWWLLVKVIAVGYLIAWQKIGRV